MDNVPSIDKKFMWMRSLSSITYEVLCLMELDTTISRVMIRDQSMVINALECYAIKKFMQ